MKPKTVEEYLVGYSGDQRTKLTELHSIIRSALPDTREALKWNAPATLDNDGMILIVFSGHKHHINLVGTPSTVAAFQDELSEFETGKGTVKLSYDKPLTAELIKKFVLYRAKEYRENGVKWK